MQKIRKNPSVVAYLAGTFSLTWLAWGTIILANQFGYLKYGTIPYMALLGLGGTAPAIIAFILFTRNKIMPAKQFFKTVFAVKQPISMYLCTIGFLVLYYGVGYLAGLYEYASPIYLSLLMFPIMIVGGGFEEVGWRFVLQPAFERKLPLWVAAMITGVIWALWHLPLFFIEGTSQFIDNFGLFTIRVFGVAFMLAVIYRISKSVWLCIFFHTLTNCLFESFRPVNLGDFEKEIVPIIILTAVCIAASLTVLAIDNAIKKRAVNH